MSILIFANGDFTGGSWTDPYFARATIVMAANGGVKHLLSMDQRPDIIVGDLDSTNRHQIEEFKEMGTTVMEFPDDKDETDLELALLLAATMDIEEILVFGALGGRWDQSLANVLLLSDPRLAGRKIYFVGENQKMWLIRETAEIDGSPGDLISLIPIDNPSVVASTRGLRWPLKNEELLVGRTRGVSNEMTTRKAIIRLEKGQLICVHSQNSGP